MTILFCHFGIIKKGGFNRNIELAKGLTALGNKVYLFTNQNNKHHFPFQKTLISNVIVYQFPDIIPHKLASKGFGLISIILKMFVLLRLKLDVVQSDSGHRPSSGIPCYIAKKIFKIPYVSEWWDDFGYQGQLKEKPFLYKLFWGYFEAKFEISNKIFADHIIVLSDVMAKRALEIGISKEKITKIHGGARIYEKNTPPCGNKIINLNCFKKTVLKIGFIGANKSDFLEILPAVKAVEKSEDVVLVTYGFTLEQEIHEKYISHSKLIQFGWIDFSTDYSKLFIPDVYIILKRNNRINQSGWPNKFGDYLGIGKPIITNLVGEIKEFYQKYPNGLIVAEYNEQSILDIIGKIKDNLFDLNNMGCCNLGIALGEYNWTEKSRTLSKIYQKLVKKNE